MIKENFTLTNPSGLKLECQIDRDETKPQQPIVFIAGGFGSEALTGSTQPVLTEMFLKKGFSVMRMNFRGNGNSEGQLSHATISAGLEDLNTALDYIRALPSGGHDIGLCGDSYGAGLLFHEVAEHPEHKYKFLILLSARIDTKWRYETDASIDLKDWKEKEFIYFRGSPRHYCLYSDTLNYHPWEVAHNIAIPTLIVHGDKDETCPYEQAERAHKLINSSELVTLKDGKHAIKERIHEIAGIISDWLDSKWY
ncbi:MAG: alpha/beta hydrolase [Rickettsiales bacterium]|jgi:pimeloyl-ACP methyl ester carboxylesterase|nr:alpha/beta hydrolase [Rickettsiales bacterium]